MRSSMNSMSAERPKLLQKILQRTGFFATVVFLGAIWYTASAVGYFGPFSEHTRISEHALMPGLVVERFDKDGLLSEYLKGLNTANGTRQGYICEQLLAVNIPCFTQKWKTTTTLKNKTGENVFGVVRARRATGAESMLLVVELEHKEAVAVLLAYATFAQEQLYWARDIFFLFVEGGALGMDAFLSKYYLVPSAGITGDDLPVPGGSLIGGIVLKSQKLNRKRKSIEVQLNQVNGQLPNLDLFNSVVRIAGMGRFGLETIIYDVFGQARGGRDWDLLVPLRAAYTQAFVAVEGSHSVMGKYGVQGLSISLPSASSYSLSQSTKLVEAIARSLNNVLERFHQSYFMYVLTSEDNFLSIAYYMPSMGVVAPLLMFAYREWTTLQSFRLPMNLLLFHIAGGVTWLSANYFFYNSTSSDSDLLCLLMVICLPWGILLPKDKKHLDSLRFISYLEFALAAMALSFLNFGLAFICSAISIPLFLRLSLPTFTASKTMLRTTTTLLVHPLSLYLAFLVYAEPALGYKTRDLSFDNFLNIMTSSLQRLLREQALFGSWLFMLLCLVALPLWNTLLAITSTTTERIIMPEGDKQEEEKKKNE